MIKKNIGKIITSTVITLIPILFGILFWNKLPNSMFIHFGADGVPDGIGSKAFSVLFLPLLLAGLNLLCIFLTSLDKKQREQHPKALNVIFFIMPIISLLVNGMMYAVSLGKRFDMFNFLPALLGLMFIFIGNYLPKVKQNSTLGIKVYWTLANEENWNKTHRFGGKVWVIGGAVMLFGLFLPTNLAVFITLASIFPLAFAPMIYSYIIYKKDKKQGIEYSKINDKSYKVGKIVSLVLIPLILIFIFFIMFTGDIECEAGENSLFIKASYIDDLNLEYSKIDSIKLVSDINVGYKNFGFNSARMCLGNFVNDEYGNYVCYVYVANDSAIEISSDGKILLLNCKTKDETETLYNELLEKIN